MSRAACSSAPPSALAALLGAAAARGAGAGAEAAPAPSGRGSRSSLATRQGSRVTQLDSGAVRGRGRGPLDEHNFHLTDRASTIAPRRSTARGKRPGGDAAGRQLHVRLRPALDRRCAASFTVGNAARPPAAPTAAACAEPTATRRRARPRSRGPGLHDHAGDGAGKRSRRLKPGTYTVTVRDRSRIHNAHMRGAGLQPRDDRSFQVERRRGRRSSRGRGRSLPVRPAPAPGHARARRRSSLRGRDGCDLVAPSSGRFSLARAGSAADPSRSDRAARDAPDRALRGDVVRVRERAEHGDAPGDPVLVQRSKQRRAISGEAP